jgi:hypothetical protein
MKSWDVFISHASEDKVVVALPLAEALQRAGFRVWLDRQELRLGDSLREKIDEGLANSRFGVVILSPSFLAKGWTRRELDGLFAVEDVAGRKVILPVWYQIDQATLARHSPLLADRLAANVADGIPAVVQAIIDVITDPQSGVLIDVALTPGRLLVTLLERQTSRSDVVGFLASHSPIIHRALGSDVKSERWSTQIGPAVVDLCASRVEYTTAVVTWYLVQFQPPAREVFQGADLTPSLIERLRELRDVRRWIGRNLRQAREILPDVGSRLSGIVVAGRRQQFSDAERESLRRYNQQLPGLTVRTYDWLVDTAAESL